MLKLIKIPFRRISQVVIKLIQFIFVVVGEDHVDILQVIQKVEDVSKDDRRYG